MVCKTRSRRGVLRTSPVRRSKKLSNYSEPGCREGSFVGPAFLRLTLRSVFLSAFRCIALLVRSVG